ncbi:hypothetical protein MLD38_018965 [Melastoma candidum]|uniref:Uncharacterized protein n=1 Tax=Melastoma candidum TaxID=119954 RepID=A0ACB9QUN4_9MYRT|nr:hypothetical protein MLD38_018965 [Melastoma candidum]
MVNRCSDDECADFLPWLERKAGVGVSSVLSIGKPVHGRALCANKDIKSGNCVMRIPFNASSMGEGIGHVAKLALVVQMEQKLAFWMGSLNQSSPIPWRIAQHYM